MLSVLRMEGAKERKRLRNGNMVINGMMTFFAAAFTKIYNFLHFSHKLFLAEHSMVPQNLIFLLYFATGWDERRKREKKVLFKVKGLIIDDFFINFNYFGSEYFCM